MATDDNNHNRTSGDAELPLPKEALGASSGRSKDAAADLIRKKIDAAYANGPSATHEGYDISLVDPKKRTKHQRYIYKLTSSGKSLVEIQAAWHEYYQGLPDEEKHEVWQEFYSTHAQASRHPVTKTGSPENADKQPRKIIAASQRPAPPRRRAVKRIDEIRGYARHRTVASASLRRIPKQFHSLLFGLGVGTIAVFIFMFGLFNERFIAPFIQPSRNITNTPIISQGANIGSEPKIIIPKINVEIPVVYGMPSIEERDVQKALEAGVVHYANTAEPGQQGNVVVVGHSSNNIFNRGKYKFAFVLLNRLESGDVFYLHKDGKRYTYQVYKRQVVVPTDVSVLDQAEKTATATLITCDPPGTDTNRLVVVGEQISPDPNANIARTGNDKVTTASIIPGNAPSLWSRFVSWFVGS